MYIFKHVLFNLTKITSLTSLIGMHPKINLTLDKAVKYAVTLALLFS